MMNLRLDFLHSPWYLLLIIPALFFTLLPYFLLSKKHRKTRNRIASMVLHSLIMVFSICVLAGMVFRYQIPNNKNEIILLVDVSDTEESSKAKRDQFIQNVLLDCEGGGFKVGVVTFGFDQEYAVPLTTDIDKIYKQYLRADLPDTSATNIAGAIEYASELFENTETAKIVLITDGKETDRKATDVISAVVSDGVKIDTAYIPSDNASLDVQVSAIELPDYHVSVDQECMIGVTLESNVETAVMVKLQDEALGQEGVKQDPSIQNVELGIGSKTIYFPHVFKSGDLHELTVKIEGLDDELAENNGYSSYMYLQVFKNILIIERASGESAALVEMLNAEKADNDKYAIKTLHYQSTEMPLTVDGFRKYEQVILNNISNPELKSIKNEATNETLDVVLEEYVREYGGGLFTVGGNNEQNESNVYNPDTMYGSLYQQMLPVDAINYTPPVGIMIIVDVSGSMTGGDVGDRPLDKAVLGALSCLDPEVLSERDYVGLMTLDDVYGKILPLTPLTQGDYIESKIKELQNATGGGTYYASALESAAQELNQQPGLARRHILVVTDGYMGDWSAARDIAYEYNRGSGITFSVLGINLTESAKPDFVDDPTWWKEEANQPGDVYGKMYWFAEKLGKGKVYPVNAQDTADIALMMRDDFRTQPIEAVNDEKSFAPVIAKTTSPLVQGLERGEDLDSNKMTVELDGYYGVKVKEAAELILTAEYGAPIYAQWKYGKGMVGSFMCDLRGNWSAAFMNDPNGKLFIDKVVKNLMPLEALTPSDIRVDHTEDNYVNTLHVYTTLQDEDYLDGELIVMSNDPTLPVKHLSLNEITAGSEEELREMPCYVTKSLSAGNGRYTNVEFVVKGSGVYKIVFTKYSYNEAGEAIPVSTVEFYKSFAYSEEYMTCQKTDNDLVDKLTEVATRGNGAYIKNLNNPEEIFAGAVRAINRSFDPRYLFIILALVCFLLDIAVRKFKFKWPHELIREYKAKRVEEKKK